MCGFLLGGTRVGSNCTTNEDCEEVENAICGPTGTCRCDRAHFASSTDTECIPGNINDGITGAILRVIIFGHLCRQNSERSVKTTTSTTSRNPFVVKGDGAVRMARSRLQISANALMVSKFN